LLKGCAIRNEILNELSKLVAICGWRGGVGNRLTLLASKPSEAKHSSVAAAAAATNPVPKMIGSMLAQLLSGKFHSHLTCRCKGMPKSKVQRKL